MQQQQPELDTLSEEELLQIVGGNGDGSDGGDGPTMPPIGTYNGIPPEVIIKE
ncbi:hypothetical protein [Ferrimonas marina]|uniref:Uncharacterized protein n=1 Tax=Ferrimonas marina TaxID=299255 RepID=A0A1M5XZQ1_9GAMM|nr:hypothetical protein [Ferrimonas marina]SHI05196.1 hypothetical protein SAMN02745129_3837 [Ferrimonas marina]